MSIGYRAIEVERRKSDGARLLKEIRLHEVSFVNLPMHPEADLEVIKADENAPEELKAFLAAMRELTAAIGDLGEAKHETDDLAVAFWEIDTHLARQIAGIDAIRARPSPRRRSLWAR
jgi:Caudovirus prohead serine protease